MKNIDPNTLKKSKIIRDLKKQDIQQPSDDQIVAIREYLADGYTYDRAINKVALDHLKQHIERSKKLDELFFKDWHNTSK